MKTTKLIEININTCDICGKEINIVNWCHICNRMICKNCTSYLTINNDHEICCSECSKLSKEYKNTIEDIIQAHEDLVFAAIQSTMRKWKNESIKSCHNQ